MFGPGVTSMITEVSAKESRLDEAAAAENSTLVRLVVGRGSIWMNASASLI
jgi:hypothetical protein